MALDDYLAADVVQTPWGRAKELRGRRLRPGPGATRELVAHNQRERLFAAMIASTATRGYSATTVADLLALAGVSRATFYEHFRSKAGCFQETVEVLLTGGLALIRDQLESQPLQHALEGFLRLAADQPRAAQVSLIDSYSAGAAGVNPLNLAFDQASELALGALRRLPGRDHTPPELARGVIGGLHRVLCRHLYRGEEDALLSRRDELWRWATGYSQPELPPSRRSSSGGSLSPGRGRDLHERIIRSFATAVATRGFPNATVPDVTAEASISNATFYQHFEDKEDAMFAALDLSGAQLVAATLPAARRAPNWALAVNRALEAVCGFLASEEDFARLRAVEVYAAGPEAVAQRDRAWEEILEELIPLEVRGSVASVTLEASNGAIDALIYEKVRRGEIKKLTQLPPLLTYIVLTPLLSSEQANAIIATAQAKPVRRAEVGRG